MTSKLLQKGSKMGPRRARMSKWWLKTWINERQGGLGETQGGSSWSQDVSKEAQDGFKMSPGGAKIGPRRPKIDDPKMSPGGPRWIHGDTGRAQEGSRSPLGPSWASNFR